MTPTQSVENARNEVRKLFPILATLRLQYDTIKAGGGLEPLASAFPEGSDITLQEFGAAVEALAEVNDLINTKLATLAKIL